MVEQGAFREDLYYRLNVIHLHLPALRERREDIPLLVDHFIDQQNERLGTDIEGTTSEAMKTMMDYPWPGNVREVQNCIERGVVLAGGNRLEQSDLPERIQESDDDLHQIFHGDAEQWSRLVQRLKPRIAPAGLDPRLVPEDPSVN